MKKSKTVTGEYNWNADGSSSVKIDNIGLHSETMQKCGILVKRFATGNEFFFGHYRLDGINLKKEEWVRYDKEIPEFFKTSGRYEPLETTVEKRGKIKTHSGYLTVGSLPVSDETYEMLPKIFHYYLDTVFFCPKIDWNTFVQSFRDYMKRGAWGYAVNGFTDFLFEYSDSGDFCISYDPNMIDTKMVNAEVKRILME